MSKFPEWVWKILALLVIPLIGWGIKLEVDKALHNERITTLQASVKEEQKEHKEKVEGLTSKVQVMEEKVSRLQDDLKEAKDMKKAIENNTLALVALKVKVDGASKTLDEILATLQHP